MPSSTKLPKELLKELLYVTDLALGAEKSITSSCYADILYLRTIFTLDCRLEDIGCKGSYYYFY